MNIVVLMAGEGNRFKSAGYNIPKPLLSHKNVTILERTTRSCPLINHTGPQSDKINLTFACRSEHNQNNELDKFLIKTYTNPNIHYFSNTTRGNLETAYLTILDQYNKQEIFLDAPLLLLDSDNAYDCPMFNSFLLKLQLFPPNMGIFVFNDLLKESKWANAKIDVGGKVLDIEEKHPDWVSFPALIGTFYFSHTGLFLQYAKYILEHSSKTRGEYFVSQVPQLYSRLGYDVYAQKVKEIIPLGTPQDWEDYKDILL